MSKSFNFKLEVGFMSEKTTLTVFCGLLQKRFKNKVATTVYMKNETLFVRYHQTEIVSIKPTNNGYIFTIDNGGYITPTTKKRINKVLNLFFVGRMKSVEIKQKNYTWYLRVYNGIRNYYEVQINKNAISFDTKIIFKPLEIEKVA
jgi:hypothetical protein